MPAIGGAGTALHRTVQGRAPTRNGRTPWVIAGAEISSAGMVI